MLNNIIVTAANTPYFDSLRTLINSIHKHSFNVVDEIIVYNLGLEKNNIDDLNKIQKVRVVDYDTSNIPYPGYLNPKAYAFKIYSIYSACKLAKNVFWLDAGVMLLNDIAEVFDIISNEDIFLVGDQHLNKNFTHQRCIEIMNATTEELDDVQLSAGIFGIKSEGKYTRLLGDAYNFSKIEDCITGTDNNHRQDQSVLSILASRYGCKKYDIDRYGYWTDLHRTYETAVKNNAVIFVHRRGYYAFSDIRYIA
jgi:lipopolysaccharide biosynthesis glycosyltransferase